MEERVLETIYGSLFNKILKMSKFHVMYEMFSKNKNQSKIKESI